MLRLKLNHVSKRGHWYQSLGYSSEHTKNNPSSLLRASYGCISWGFWRKPTTRYRFYSRRYSRPFPILMMWNTSRVLLSLMLNTCKCDCPVNLRLFDIPASLDGSWESSHMDSRHGFLALGFADTGVVLDWHYLRCRCPACAMWSGREDTNEYMDWWGEHT